jgi:hypothetical protein
MVFTDFPLFLINLLLHVMMVFFSQDRTAHVAVIKYTLCVGRSKTQ